MGKKQYDYTGNKKLSNYVRAKYGNQIPKGAMRLYLLALPYLEEKKSGFCQQITANYDEIAKAGCIYYSGLKSPLLKLKDVLCDIQIGKPIKNGREATVIRRYNLAELKEAKLKSKVIDTSPGHAQELSEILESRSFVYGDNLKCKPFWSIGKTGRVVSKKPNAQGDSKIKRAAMLCHGLKDGQVLFDLDIKQAEPSIIQQALKYELPPDPYKLLAGIMGISRNAAKPELNKLAYAKSAVNIIKHWPIQAQEVFGAYAKALDNYKAKLWAAGEPSRNQRRFADTLGGSRICANKGDRTNRGQPLCWYAQGTVADIINPASIEIILREQADGWKYLFPVHDSIYVVGKTQQSEKLKQIILGKAKELGLDLSVEVKSYPVGKNQ